MRDATHLNLGLRMEILVGAQWPDASRRPRFLDLDAMYPWHASEGVDFFPFPLTPASFATGPSDCDMPSDEITCPCGVELGWPYPYMLGTAVEVAQDHIDQAHPRPERVLPAMPCEHCGRPGTVMTDPYMEELYNERVTTILCADCLQERLDDI